VAPDLRSFGGWARFWAWVEFSGAARFTISVRGAANKLLKGLGRVDQALGRTFSGAALFMVFEAVKKLRYSIFE
jgi:hypothetical protein